MSSRVERSCFHFLDKSKDTSGSPLQRLTICCQCKKGKQIPTLCRPPNTEGNASPEELATISGAQRVRKPKLARDSLWAARVCCAPACLAAPALTLGQGPRWKQ